MSNNSLVDQKQLIEHTLTSLNLLYGGPMIAINEANDLRISQELMSLPIGRRFLKLLRENLPGFIEPEKIAPKYRKRLQGLAGSA